jgi:predicted transposase YdaD
VALMVLTTLEESQAPDEARYLLQRTSVESSSRAIIELVTTIMVYKFENLSQKEVEVMLGITLQETRVYREIKAEWLVKGREQEAASLILRLLTKRFGVVSVDVRSRISGLPLVVLEDLSEAILDFVSLDDLQVWLAEYEK